MPFADYFAVTYIKNHGASFIAFFNKSKYIFIIEDTLYTEMQDSVFVISYRPKPNTNFDGLEGLLYINSNKWAIQNAIARPDRRDEYQDPAEI